MSEKILSIIVPSYNMEKYLPRCLGSLVVPPGLMERLEVLVVNDGSKDRTSEIAHEFEAKWPATFKVIDKQNGNYGSCINAALPVATGEFVKVLDADDYLDPEALSKLLSILPTVKDDKIGLVLTDYDIVDEKGEVTQKNILPFEPEQAFSTVTFLKSGVYVPMHAYAYRRAIFDNLGYVQKEGISYTDTEWALLPLVAVESVIRYPLTVYKYLIGRADQTMAPEVWQKSQWMRDEVFLDMARQFATLGRRETDACRAVGDDIYLKVENVYRQRLIINPRQVGGVEIKDFDEQLKKVNGEIYSHVHNACYAHYFPCRFVDAWERHSILFPIMRRLCIFYTKLATRGCSA